MWIETAWWNELSWLPSGHFPCRSVDWNHDAMSLMYSEFGHFPCGSVDWNNPPVRQSAEPVSHFPCGSVDWNTSANIFSVRDIVTSLAEVWIETCNVIAISHYLRVTSLAEVWIETCIFLSSFSSLMVTSLAEVWIETGWDRMFWPNILSLPLRKCGLKQELSFVEWTKYSHFPCGSVDWNMGIK